MPATAATLTAWELWDRDHDRLKEVASDAECDKNDADAEYRGACELVKDLEKQLMEARKQVLHWATQKAGTRETLASAKRVVRDHAKHEPDQD